jgi:hypothetical protein
MDKERLWCQVLTHKYGILNGEVVGEAWIQFEEICSVERGRKWMELVYK